MNINNVKALAIALLAMVTLSPTDAAAYTAPDPLDMCWTFGAHEPYTMYRRMGVRSTGGIHGNCYWLPEWFKWWDSEACPKQMEELGLNWLLCRFYKGMGWHEEKKDFPNVKRFVANCRKNGVKPIAYVQFLTLYPETMKKEIPNLESWAAVRADGTKYYYSNYFRWFPCFNNPEFEKYLKKIIKIALTETEFEGVFFDNAFTPPCYCPRCKKLFHEHLQTIKNPADRFGFDSLADFGMPEYPGYHNPSLSLTQLPWGEIREPLLQEFNDWRAKRMTALFQRFYDYAHSVKPNCVVAANTCPYRAPCTVEAKSVDMTEFPKCFDLVMGQVDNCPHVEGDGSIVNRVRDLKYAREFAATYFASCDGAAGDSENEVEESYLLPLIEDLVFGGVPADRTIMAPYADPSGGFVNVARRERRRPQLAAFQKFARERRALFADRDWMPVRLVVSSHAMAHSQASFDGLMSAEAAALRGHVPFGYAISTEESPLPHADEEVVMVVANQTCLSEAQVGALVAYAKRGGRLVCTGESGRFDEWNRQRHLNPLKEATKGLANVVWRDEPDVAKAKVMNHIKYTLRRPVRGSGPFLDDLAKTGWRGAVEVVSAPETVFAQYKTDGKAITSVHLVNYVFTKPAGAVRLRVPEGRKPVFSAPFDAGVAGAPREVGTDVWELPDFQRYAYVTFAAK